MVITLTSMFGIVVLLCTSCTDVFQLCIQFCISMAVGSLTGDALLHLLPMVSDFSCNKQLFDIRGPKDSLSFPEDQYSLQF